MAKWGEDCIRSVLSTVHPEVLTPLTEFMSFLTVCLKSWNNKHSMYNNTPHIAQKIHLLLDVTSQDSSIDLVLTNVLHESLHLLVHVSINPMIHLIILHSRSYPLHFVTISLDTNPSFEDPVSSLLSLSFIHSIIHLLSPSSLIL